MWNRGDYYPFDAPLSVDDSIIVLTTGTGSWFLLVVAAQQLKLEMFISEKRYIPVQVKSKMAANVKTGGQKAKCSSFSLETVTQSDIQRFCKLSKHLHLKNKHSVSWQTALQTHKRNQSFIRTRQFTVAPELNHKKQNISGYLIKAVIWNKKVKLQFGTLYRSADGATSNISVLRLDLHAPIKRYQPMKLDQVPAQLVNYYCFSSVRHAEFGGFSSSSGAILSLKTLNIKYLEILYFLFRLQRFTDSTLVSLDVY